MSYRVQIPRRQPEAGTEMAATPEVIERRRAAVNAFSDLFCRLAILFPDGIGALDSERPDVWAGIKATERRVDAVALRYIAGQQSKEAFGRALHAYEQAWRNGADARAGHGSGQK